MITGRQYLAGCGTQPAGLAFGGSTTVASAATEEYTPGTSPVTTASTLTTS